MKPIDSPIYPNGMTALEHAVEHLDLDAARAALAAGADPNRADEQGIRPLHSSVDGEMEDALYRFDTAGDTSPPTVEMTKLLLSYGADPLLADASGRTPVDWARDRGHNAALE